MACPICAGSMEPCFTAQVLGKYPAHYEVCKDCGFLRAHEPHWLDEAYSCAIAAADTGLVIRNIALAYKLAGALYWILGERSTGRYLDAAGGYGMLTRLMRDLGFDFYWADKHCKNLLAPGFEYNQARGTCRAVTAVEVLEHLTDPVGFIEEMLAFRVRQWSCLPQNYTKTLYHSPVSGGITHFPPDSISDFSNDGRWRFWVQGLGYSSPARTDSISSQKRP